MILFRPCKGFFLWNYFVLQLVSQGPYLEKSSMDSYQIQKSRNVYCSSTHFWINRYYVCLFIVIVTLVFFQLSPFYYWLVHFTISCMCCHVYNSALLVISSNPRLVPYSQTLLKYLMFFLLWFAFDYDLHQNFWILFVYILLLSYFLIKIYTF